ncbi:EscU/YscU/HrcU family type III secretion system export apparatus switch protein [Henriciella litoralis]|uniref:EscU/YscU/HrcU family type III secretion system export apparatus switch protein n=1 Tax=Henriciella litoralis TaxID=568102 RepID=UPI0009FFAAD5|nr:EscU/YscU/HrcU family type III secretion system export apparatus switch protein [Henriciella litoralis]
MAEDQNGGGEKEFEATEQRKREARREGNVAQSKEVNAFALMAGMALAAALFVSVLAGGIFAQMQSLFYHADSYADDIFAGGGQQSRDWLISILFGILPVFLVLVVLVLGALVLQGSVAFSAKKIKPDIKKISPPDNLKKKYGPKGLIDFAKDTAKMLFAGLIASYFLYTFVDQYYASSAIRFGQFFQFTFAQVMGLILLYCLFQFVLAAIDLPIQRQMHANQLKMTREDIKKEVKQSEGDPHVKQSRREKASKISRGQMMQNVKTATVVMVNPEHYAVALKWDPDSSKAPVVVAKGVDHLAARIRETAIAHDVPIYRDPPSTRSIYRLVEIDEEIHAEHFAAVAAAIGFVERLRQHL